MPGSLVLNAPSFIYYKTLNWNNRVLGVLNAPNLKLTRSCFGRTGFMEQDNWNHYVLKAPTFNLKIFPSEARFLIKILKLLF